MHSPSSQAQFLVLFTSPTEPPREHYNGGRARSAPTANNWNLPRGLAAMVVMVMMMVVVTFRVCHGHEGGKADQQCECYE